MAQKTLQIAKTVKNDEFYTQLKDIEEELKHYKEQFKNKVVYCNCDDPYESNFFKYFAANFKELGLKKLITTSYNKSPIIGTQLSMLDIEGLKPKGKDPLKIEINEVLDLNKDGAVSLADVEYLLRHDANVATPLKSDNKYPAGDFRSKDCVKLLEQADIVVTNPPFSLFREYLSQLIEKNKKFLIIGNKNAITYKETFDYIKRDLLWLGYRNPNEFYLPNGNITKQVQGLTRWFTNLEVTKRYEMLNLYKRYDSVNYPKYVNYDAIEVSKVSDIPLDYEDVMGVPITFIDKYNPIQFEIIGTSRSHSVPMSTFATKGTYEQGGPRFYLDKGNGTYLRLYERILIKNKKVEK